MVLVAPLLGHNVPIVGMVVTISPSFNLYRIVVFPAASRPTMRIRISFFPHSRSNSFEILRPMATMFENFLFPDVEAKKWVGNTDGRRLQSEQRISQSY